MSFSVSDHTSFTFLLFIQLARRLRQTNARYHHIAYQCRHARRPTYHAKQHAYRAGLCIDTTKARGAYVDNVVLSQTANPDSTRLLSALSVFVSGETGTGDGPEESRASIDEGCMSSSGLTLRSLPEVGVQTGDVDVDPEPYRMPDQVPVPGAPRWTTRALPDEDAPACGAVWRGAMAEAPALDVDAVQTGVKRKVDGSVGEAPRRPEVGAVDESQKRRREL